MAFGGENSPAARLAITESWNGTSWTEVSDLNTARHVLAGAGASNTSALAFGGDTPPNSAITESWNGSSWTEVNDMNVAQIDQPGAGTATSALAFGGGTPRGPVVGETESWNGTSWTNENKVNTAVRLHGGAGATSSAAIKFAGNTGTQTNASEEWYGDGLVTLNVTIS